MAEYVKKDGINPWSDYGYINLPKYAVITKVEYAGYRADIYYTSNSEKAYEEDGGYDYYCFQEGEDIQITMSNEKEKRKCIYASVIRCAGKDVLVMICKWEKKK